MLIYWSPSIWNYIFLCLFVNSYNSNTCTKKMLLTIKLKIIYVVFHLSDYYCYRIMHKKYIREICSILKTLRNCNILRCDKNYRSRRSLHTVFWSFSLFIKMYLTFYRTTSHKYFRVNIMMKFPTQFKYWIQRTRKIPNCISKLRRPWGLRHTIVFGIEFDVDL